MSTHSDTIFKTIWIPDIFELMPDNVKKDLLLFGHSRFNKNKNKVILEATIKLYKKFWKIL